MEFRSLVKSRPETQMVPQPPEQKANSQKLRAPAADEGSSRPSIPAVNQVVSSTAGASTNSTSPAIIPDGAVIPPHLQECSLSEENGETETKNLVEVPGRSIEDSELVSTSTKDANTVTNTPPAAARILQNAEREVNHLVDIEYDEVGDTSEERRKKRVAKMALKEWKENVQVLEGKVERRNKQIDSLNFEIYQLVGLFSVFAGVVFTAVTQSSSLERHHIWSPVVLCFFAYVVIVFVTISKFQSIKCFQETNHRDEEYRKIARNQIRQLQTRGHAIFDFSLHIPEKNAPAEYKPPSTALYVTLTGLTVFLFLLWASFFHIIFTKSTTCEDLFG